MKFAEGECDGSEFEMSPCENNYLVHVLASAYIFIHDNIFQSILKFITDLFF